MTVKKKKYEYKGKNYLIQLAEGQDFIGLDLESEPFTGKIFLRIKTVVRKEVKK